MSSPDLPFSSLTTSTEGGPFEDLNAAFVLNSGYLVFFMHCGFAMVSFFTYESYRSILNAVDLHIRKSQPGLLCYPSWSYLLTETEKSVCLNLLSVL